MKPRWKRKYDINTVVDAEGYTITGSEISTILESLIDIVIEVVDLRELARSRRKKVKP